MRDYPLFLLTNSRIMCLFLFYFLTYFCIFFSTLQKMSITASNKLTIVSAPKKHNEKIPLVMPFCSAATMAFFTNAGGI